MTAPGWAEEAFRKAWGAGSEAAGNARPIREEMASARRQAAAAELSRLCVSREEFERVREALTLAANRLHRCCVEFETGSKQFIEYSEWAQEARAALKDQFKEAGDGD